MGDVCPRCGFKLAKQEHVWGFEVRRARIELGLARCVAASEMDICDNTLKRIEAGESKAHRRIARIVAGYLGVDLPPWCE